MDTDVNGGTISLVSVDSFDVDNELFTVNLYHLAHLLSLEVSSHNLMEKLFDKSVTFQVLNNSNSM